jgi:hypothetical protein
VGNSVNSAVSEGLPVSEEGDKKKPIASQEEEIDA